MAPWKCSSYKNHYLKSCWQFEKRLRFLKGLFHSINKCINQLRGLCPFWTVIINQNLTGISRIVASAKCILAAMWLQDVEISLFSILQVLQPNVNVVRISHLKYDSLLWASLCLVSSYVILPVAAFHLPIRHPCMQPFI